MNIRLLDWKITKIDFSLLNEEIEKDEGKFNLESERLFPENKDKGFVVSFRLSISDDALSLFLEASFNFEAEEAITEEFKLSTFPSINAPAIAFPYLRAFISNLTLQAGIKPIILPSLNFVKLAELEESSQTD